jgi:hypothetical protein
MNTPEQQKEAIELIRNASADQLQQLTQIWLSSGGKPRDKKSGTTPAPETGSRDENEGKP